MVEACVILDIGGVLEITPETGWLGRWEERLGMPPGAVDERMHDVWRGGSLGHIGEREVRDQLSARLGIDSAHADAFMEDFWHEYVGTANEELIDYVRGLRGSCRLGILSNSFVGARERETELYGFDELVERILYSHEIGVAKPDPRAFEAACAALDARPEDCLFIDDLTENVRAAQAAGLKAHLFEGNAGAFRCIAAHLDGAPSSAG
ncbi:HAD family hydrolase [Streptomyces fuscigenes]|uniref:HAD family hydrolase n=1 Tax=Streptomyces fuscigenes TaxID=1528880 RepID=UPI001F42C19A|nr:HAD family phosphatase [Streptomyces fuscigenes]MCF3962045.1 HAD family phosphatase [Streptomyces fuscigenes]